MSGKIFVYYNGEEVGTGNISKLEVDSTQYDTTTFRKDVPDDIMMSFTIQDKDTIEYIMEFLQMVRRRRRKHYMQPHYINRFHPRKVIKQYQCRIRNRPNSGHGFKNNKY